MSAGYRPTGPLGRLRNPDPGASRAGHLRLRSLATDDAYTAAVRTTAKQLIGAGALGQDVCHALPLTSYGPAQPGSILRLPHVLRMLDPTCLPDGLLDQLVDLTARIPE